MTNKRLIDIFYHYSTGSDGQLTAIAEMPEYGINEDQANAIIERVFDQQNPPEYPIAIAKEFERVWQDEHSWVNA